MFEEPDLFYQPPAPWQPHNYQKRMVKFLLEHAAGALFASPGVGKTSVTMAAIKLLKKKGLTGKVWIIAPLRVCHATWPRELKKWTDFKDLTIEVLHGPKKDQALQREADIYVLNPEGLDWLFGAKREKKIVRGRERTVITIDLARAKKILGPNPLLVIDELTKFKSHSSGRFKLMKEVLHLFSRRWGLTGSPAANGLLDLFGQCYMLDQGRSLGQYITHYRTTYFRTVDKQGFVWVPLPGAEERIYERLDPLVMRVAAEDYLELPQLVENIIKIDLPDNVRKIYDALEEDLITGIDSDIIVAKNAAVASMKCRQVASGGLYITPEVEELVKRPKGQREWYDLHWEKVDALEDLVEELQGQPLLVAYDFGHSLARLQERFKGRPRTAFVSEVKPKDFPVLEAQWNNNELDLLFAHPLSIAHGLNMQECGQHVAWLDDTWDYEAYMQFIMRILRQGNKHKRVFVHHIVARDTIDEAMLWSRKSKKKGQDALFAGLQQLAKQRHRK